MQKSGVPCFSSKTFYNPSLYSANTSCLCSSPSCLTSTTGRYLEIDFVSRNIYEFIEIDSDNLLRPENMSRLFPNLNPIAKQTKKLERNPLRFLRKNIVEPCLKISETKRCATPKKRSAGPRPPDQLGKSNFVRKCMV